MATKVNYIVDQATEAQEKKLQISFRASHLNYFIYSAFLIQLILNLIWITLTELAYSHLYGLGKFYFDLEDSVPTYFSSIILLFSAILMAIISLAKIKISDPFSKHWIILSILFVFLSIEEVAGFHETIIDPLNSLFQFKGYWRFSWVIPGIIFGLIFAISYLKFLNSLASKYKWGLIYAGLVYILGAIFIEMISANIYINTFVSAKDILYNLVITLEESCEMLGVMMLISVLLSYIKSLQFQISISIK